MIVTETVGVGVGVGVAVVVAVAVAVAVTAARAKAAPSMALQPLDGATFTAASAHAGPLPPCAGQLSTEQKTVLAKKEKEITAARALAGKGTVKEPNRRLSAWQQKLDEAEASKLTK